MKKRILNILALAIFCGAAFCWGFGTIWVRHVTALDKQYTLALGPEGPYHDEGVRSIGFYAGDGRCGIVTQTEMTLALQGDEHAYIGLSKAQWYWSRKGDIIGYFGCVPEDLVPQSITWHIPFVCYVGHFGDAAMRHDLVMNVYLLDCRFLMLIAAIPLALSGYKYFRRRRRIRSGCCLKCGYDLRASKERCPECGEPIVGAAST